MLKCFQNCINNRIDSGVDFKSVLAPFWAPEMDPKGLSHWPRDRCQGFHEAKLMNMGPPGHPGHPGRVEPPNGQGAGTPPGTPGRSPGHPPHQPTLQQAPTDGPTGAHRRPRRRPKTLVVRPLHPLGSLFRLEQRIQNFNRILIAFWFPKCSHKLPKIEPECIQNASDFRLCFRTHFF